MNGTLHSMLQLLPLELLDVLDSVKGKKVAVGMSGGVDSSVCALLLKEAGAEVQGLIMKNTDSDDGIRSAQKVADYLDISLEIVDLREEFHRIVIDYFVKEYKNGRTPNPCVVCNQLVKFGMLWDRYRAKADYYATGHYTIKELDGGGRHVLRRAVDAGKDQSYALSMLKQEQLAKAVFILGYMKKSQVKEIAEKAGLPITLEKESMDLCFTEDRNRFLKGVLGEKSGKLISQEGKILGKHKGVQYYAIGQRKGIGLVSDKAYYVKGINTEKNKVVIGRKEDLYSKEFLVSGPNWVSISNLSGPMPAEVVVRNKTVPQPCVISPVPGDRVKVSMKEPVWAVSPGQLAVFYKGDLVLGGGWIE